MENALFIISAAHDGLSWLARSACLVIAALIVVSLFFGARGRTKRKTAAGRIDPDSGRMNPTMSLLAAGLFLTISVYGLIPAISWPANVGQLPKLTFILSVCLSLLALRHGVRNIQRASADVRDMFPARGEIRVVGQLYVWRLGTLAATVVAGQLVALPLAVALYLLICGRHAWWIVLLYGTAAWLLLYLVFDRVVAVVWYPSLLSH